MHKIGKANLARAEGFHQQQNWVQVLRYSELAATKLKQLKDRSLETVELINGALICKFDALTRLGRYREGMECIKECYSLWAMNHMRNPGSIKAALGLIQSCIHNRELEDAERYARHAYFMVAEMTDNFIPVDQRPPFLADVSYWLATAIYHLAETGGIPPEQKQKIGEEAITFARQALEIHTRLHGTENVDVASDMGILADVLDCFNDVDNDEILRLRQQSIAIYRRMEGISSVNVASHENNLGNVYFNRSRRAQAADDLDRVMANLELALSHFREAARIYRANNIVDSADNCHRNIERIEQVMELIIAGA